MSAHHRVADVLEIGCSDVWQFAALIVLAHHANQSDGCAWPSVSTISKATGMSKRRVQYALRGLEAAALIQPLGSRKGGRGKSVRYRLLLPSLAGKGAPDARFRDHEEDGKSARRAPYRRQKGCTDEPERVHGSTVKGAHGAPEPLNRKEPAPPRLRTAPVQDTPREKIWTLGVTILTAAGRNEPAARAMLGRWIRDHGEEAVAGALGAAATRADPVAYVHGVLRRHAKRQANGSAVLLTFEEELAARGAAP